MVHTLLIDIETRLDVVEGGAHAEQAVPELVVVYVLGLGANTNFLQQSNATFKKSAPPRSSFTTLNNG